MKWQGREQSSNIEDRRSQGGAPGGGLGGGLGGGGFGNGGGIRIPMGRSGGLGSIGLIIVVVLICWALGINPMSLLDGSYSGPDTTTSSSIGSSTSQPSANAGQDELKSFVGVVTKETENMWGDIFSKNGRTYTPPKIVLYNGQSQSGCGIASAEGGPFYCPDDRKVYIDLRFYDQLRKQFGAPGDFAQAYVIAHEVGHHVQNLLGVLPEFTARRASMSRDQANAYSVRVELQADCYAGVWANYVGQENILENGDLQEALNAAQQIGDDTIQRSTQGTVQPRNFTHGTSAQRQRWFTQGYKSGNPAQCDTFSGSV
jgi:predicted metalloprotease